MRRAFAPKRWRTLSGDMQAEAQLQIELGVHPIVARLLVQRGLTTPEDAYLFLHPALDSLHDPFLLPDIEPACERLKLALANKEKIFVHGDYDGDGVTSAALWTRTLRSLGGDVNVFVPHRGRDGYDIRARSVEQAKRDGVTLIVTTDCGIQRVEEVELAREYGIDVIVTDHHTPNANGELPKALAVINPHRKDSRYPFPDLAGVGVAFKVGEALIRTLGHNVANYRRAYLDLAAIGTVTDVMPLLGENRIIVKYGLQALRETKKPGLRALIKAAGYAEKELDARAIGFHLGPRLNSASRVDETQIALDLLMTKDEIEAEQLAQRLNTLNAARQEQTARILEEAQAQVAQQDISEARCLVVSGANWPGGLVGLVANKIVERYCRPCVVIALDEAAGSGRGSARSIRAFNILQAIDSCRDLLDEYGGHAYAAGLSIKSEAVEDFSQQMNRIATSLLTEEDMQPGLEVAAELAPSDICPELLMQLEALAPFGSGNHEPLFVSRGLPIVEVSRMGAEKQHLRITFKAEGVNGRGLVASPWWNRGDLQEGLHEVSSLDACYKLKFNEWNGNRSIQFMLEDIRPADDF